MTEPHRTPAAAFGFRAQTVEQFEAEVAPLIGPVIRSSFKGRFIHEFVGVKPRREWLLKNVLLARTFCLIVGMPGCGKSFLALDLAMTMALAAVDPAAPQEWFGLKIKPCGVTYIAAEGQDDFIIRMQAWLHAKGLPPTTRLPMFLIPTAVDLRTDPENAKKLAEEIKLASAIMQAEFGCAAAITVVDTLNRALAGGDDSKSEHVGPFIKSCTVIRDVTATTVIAVHHTPKNGDGDSPRGHGSLRGDNDGEVFVRPARGEAPNSWTVTRNKSGPTGDRFEFRLRRHVVDRDEDGEEVTSCIVAPGARETSSETQHMHDAGEAARTGKPNMTADGRVILQPNAQRVMRVLHELIQRETAKADRPMPPPDVRAPHGRVAVLEGELFEEIVRSMPGYVEPAEGNKADVDKHRDRCRKHRDAALTRLPERGLIGLDKGWVWRTGRRVAGIDRPEHDEFAPKPSRPTMEQLGMTQDDLDKMF